MNPNFKPIDVMIAGAQKAGTSSLGDYLDQHPNVTTHSQLEMAFFVRDEEYELGYDDMYSKYFSPASESELVLAKSVGIMYFPEAMQRLYTHNPNCKIVVILREPVSRAYSAYWYMRRMGWETSTTFAEALALESERKVQNLAKWSPCLYRDRGIYSRQIKNLYDCFGSQNVHVVLLDDLMASPVQTMTKIQNFMGLECLELNTSKKSNSAKIARFELLSRMLKSSPGIKDLCKRFVPTEYLTSTRRYVQGLNERSVKIPSIDPQSRSELAAFFEPHNRELEDLLNCSLESWKLPKKARAGAIAGAR